ncbi:type VI secretion system baseplate subunit TssF [Paraburkholderia sp. A1RI-2L]|uniref:type VI secretion system baseplate subunit TssF n=1 Tax=Paraburkholderia sp. A1RI-2L TaxID=3028367 RepID=UPI003B81A51F
MAQRLAPLSASHLSLFCTPVVNLFRPRAQPLKRDPVTGLYPVNRTKTAITGSEIWSVNEVRNAAGTAPKNVIRPFTSLMHGSSAKLAGPTPGVIPFRRGRRRFRRRTSAQEWNRSTHTREFLLTAHLLEIRLFAHQGDRIGVGHSGPFQQKRLDLLPLPGG